MTETYIEETWWEVTIAPTGLILTLPAPLLPTGAPMPPIQALDVIRKPLQSHSAITGKSYAVNLADAIQIKTTIIKADPERYQRAVMKASAGLSLTSSPSGQTPESSSANRTNPRGRSTGGRTKPSTH